MLRINKRFKKFKSIVVIAVLICAVTISSFSFKQFSVEPMKIVIPSNFPSPLYNFKDNPLTKEGFELGRKLFYDGTLSRTGTVSCGSCHQQASAFIQADHDLSHGVDDQLGRRNSLPIFNALFKKTFFWDGGVPFLELVPVNPIENPLEMDEKLDNVIKKLNASTKYRELFKNAFGVDVISSKEFLQAFAQFMGAMISANSKYDKYVRNEGVQLSADELDGLNLFKQKCSSCHATDLFTDGSYRNNGITTDFSSDKGREEVTLNPLDRAKFKVPSLRNVEYTAPYMHDGSFETLEQVLEHYNSGVKESATLDSLLKHNNENRGIPLTKVDQKKIIVFLKTLTDKDFLKDTKFSEPQ